MEVEEFLNRKGTADCRRKNGSPLWEYEKQIRELLDKGCSVSVVKEFLETNGLAVSRSWLYSFINKNLKNSTKKEVSEGVKNKATEDLRNAQAAVAVEKEAAHSAQEKTVLPDPESSQESPKPFGNVSAESLSERERIEERIRLQLYWKNKQATNSNNQ